MKPVLRVILYGAAAVLVFVLLVYVWRYAATSYDDVAAGVTMPFVARGVEIQSMEEDAQLILYYKSSKTGSYQGWRVKGLTFHYGPLLMTALILATPALAWRRKALWTLGAWAGFSGLYVVSLILMSWSLAAAVESGSAAMQQLGLWLPIFFRLLPAALAGVWCYSYWLPNLGFRSEGLVPASQRQAKR